ncbi:hypothetical protein E2C01_073556 [Portunus trituberculatus]|uniref:Uncharacterized protein n=1 Tax=Portunus trituberculatus TaxID=210409 RepID=A0A5B7IE87_PORTR|nr:hypothetical protein [Portunus trituberculatus]
MGKGRLKTHVPVFSLHQRPRHPSCWSSLSPLSARTTPHTLTPHREQRARGGISEVLQETCWLSLSAPSPAGCLGPHKEGRECCKFFRG